jgi:hypothetical protein
MPYNSVRLVHTWVGYIDVLTESVSITADSSVADSKTVALLRTAAILEMTQGADHTIASFFLAPELLGPDKPSLDGEYVRAFQQGLDWVYDVESDGGSPPVYTTSTVDYWFIRDIKILDNGQNTSRVTFTFEIIEPWEPLKDIIEAL